MLVVISELLLLLKTLGVISGSLLSISVNTAEGIVKIAKEVSS